MHRALEADHQTTVGDHCLLMANAHVAHDCRVGNQVIFTNNAMLAGTSRSATGPTYPAAEGVHQFCRIGPLAMVGGQAHIIKDVPPFVTIDGQSSYVVGLNQIGLPRGYDQRTILQVKDAYRLIYRSGLMWRRSCGGCRRSSAGAWRPSSIPSWQPPSGASSPSSACPPAHHQAALPWKSRSGNSAARRARASAARPGLRDLFLRILEIFSSPS